VTIDTQPFEDLGYRVRVRDEEAEVPTYFVDGLDNYWVLTDENYDDVLAKAKHRSDTRTLMRTARQTFRDNYQNWPTMTAAQKDQANRQAQRALAALITDLLKDDTGV
jgi:hypothetical protein